jgi:hypothetical protein
MDGYRISCVEKHLNGKLTQHLLMPGNHIVNLFQYGDHIYWTDWYRKSVERADKRTGKDRIVIRTDLDGVMEIRAVAARRQMGWSPCGAHNGGCTHLCLYRQTSYVCACPDIPDDRPCSKGKTSSTANLWKTYLNGNMPICPCNCV